MRSLAFLISGVFLIFSCTQQEEQKNSNSGQKEVEGSSADSLPEGKWNGEYLKIDDGEEPKIKRKSQGSDFYSMGNVKFKIGDDLVEFQLFERKKNALIFTNQSIKGFIKSAFNEDLHISFKKKDIVVNHKGKYKSDPAEKANNSFNISIKAGKSGEEKEYTLESGEAEILHFSPRMGTLEVKIIGTFSAKDGTKQKGEGTIKMNFEQAIMTAQ